MKSEARIQQEIVLWFHNTYPELRGLLCYNNNNSTGGRRATLNKYLGVIPGRSDMVFYFNKQAFMIELKTEKGKQQPIQKKWEVTIKDQGFEYYIIRNLEDFKVLVGFILNRHGF